MTQSAIVRVGDSTTHHGTVIEGFPHFSIDGRLAAGKGHKVSCPKCRGVFAISEGAEARTIDGVPIALDGMLTACGARLLASQQMATVESGFQVGRRSRSSTASSVDTVIDEDIDDVQDGIVEQWLALEGEHGEPVEGYKYDLFEGTFKHAFSAQFDSGATVRIPGERELRITMWLDSDSAERG